MLTISLARYRNRGSPRQTSPHAGLSEKAFVRLLIEDALDERQPFRTFLAIGD
jgi:hypothetical protein